MTSYQILFLLSAALAGKSEHYEEQCIASGLDKECRLVCLKTFLRQMRNRTTIVAENNEKLKICKSKCYNTPECQITTTQNDLIVAIDLDCVNEQNTLAIQSFATELITAIFAHKSYVERGYIRVGIIGFHNSLQIEMPLSDMSFVKNRQNEVGYNKALQAIRTLISIARNKANQESASFTQMFSLIPTLFDARNRKSRQLIIISNASPGIRYPGWSKYALEDLSRMRQRLYSNIQITAVAVNAEQCRGNYGTWTEDCFFSDALMRIDRSFNTRRTLMGARSEAWSTFYESVVSQMHEEISHRG